MQDKEAYKPIREINAREKYIKINVPLTQPSGKMRIKERNNINSYGLPVATRKNAMKSNSYLEWQISYDAETDDKKNTTTITNRTFVGSNGKLKHLFELSEFIKYFYDWGIVPKETLLLIKEYLIMLGKEKYICERFQINRACAENININGTDFLLTKAEYPLLIYHCENSKGFLEIQIKEKQHAVGTQPMVYFCLPFSELDDNENILNRTANPKETATLTLNESDANALLGILKIFGTLSERHNKDIINIIDLILDGGHNV